MNKLAVFGGGAWGTALATVLASDGQSISLVVRNPQTAYEINTHHKNSPYLAEIALNPLVEATPEINDLAQAQTILVVVPTQALRRTFEMFAKIGLTNQTLVLCAKGLEQETGKRVSEISKEILPQNPFAILSGPSFAHDVAKGLPTAVTLAADTLTAASDLAGLLSRKSLRLYASQDVIGVELGGALKNVIALGVGIVRGRGLGTSAEAALTTRGFIELGRIAGHFGAFPETLTGLSGLGDLILTCSGTQSRNFTYGLKVGRGESLEGLKLAEGLYTTAIAAKLCHDMHIEAPIVTSIHDILTKKSSIEEAMTTLMARPLKPEGT